MLEAIRMRREIKAQKDYRCNYQKKIRCCKWFIDADKNQRQQTTFFTMNTSCTIQKEYFLGRVMSAKVRQ